MTFFKEDYIIKFEVIFTKLKYLGTAAAEAVPAPFCECETCEKARKSGGRNIRTRSQAMIDDKILIDFGPDTLMHAIRENIKFLGIEGCIITHPHQDHLYPQDFLLIESWAAHSDKFKPFNVYGTQETIDEIFDKCSFAQRLINEGRLTLNLIKPFEPFNIGEYKITPLKADHGTKEPVFYIIEKGDKAMLYANDTGVFPKESVEYLKNYDVKFDLVSYDCTNVLLTWIHAHMGLNGNVMMRDLLSEMGRLKENATHICHHFSHNGLAGYDDFAPVAAKEGFLVSYDGMEIEF